MAKISGEIREWVRRARADEHMDMRELDALADRIDTEMVELPLSADGKIWSGREVFFWTDAEQEGSRSFGCIALNHGKWYVEDIDCMEFPAESVWIERPDSFERIADELEGLSVDSTISDVSLVSACALDLAKRIRKLAKMGGTQ